MSRLSEASVMNVLDLKELISRKVGVLSGPLGPESRPQSAAAKPVAKST